MNDSIRNRDGHQHISMIANLFITKYSGIKIPKQKLRLQTNTNFYGASLSKAVFAVLVMKLVEEKIISLTSHYRIIFPNPCMNTEKDQAGTRILLH